MLLLDSTAFLWLLYTPERVGLRARQQLEAEGEACVSVVTLWELAIKYAAGTLPYSPQELLAGVEALDVTVLAMSPRHILALQAVALPQKDPFDRLLIAQSEAESFTFMTSDHHILNSQYGTVDVSE